MTDMAKVRRAILVMVLVSVTIAGVSLAGILSLYADSPSSSISSSLIAEVGGQPGSQPSTSTPAVSSVLASNGLRLTASISSAKIEVSQSLNISVSLSNALPSVNTVVPSNLTAFQGFPVAFWPTCFGTPPVEFVALRGNYSAADLREDGNTTGPSPSVACAEYGLRYGLLISDFVFQPGSDRAVLTGVFVSAVGSNLNATRGPYDLASNFTVDGYWSYPFTGSESQDLLTPVGGGPGTGFVYPEVGPVADHPFAVGVYTLMVEDEWGQVVILHFTVVPATSPSAQLSSLAIGSAGARSALRMRARAAEPGLSL
jgi:hypothetical protein